MRIEWRGGFENHEVNALHGECFNHPIVDDDWERQLREHSLGWVCARDKEFVGSDVLAQTPVPVIPVALSGLWGSLFSRRTRSVWRRLPRKLWARVRIAAGAPVSPGEASPEMLHERVAALCADPAAAPPAG